MARHLGCFAQHATPPTGQDSIKAFAEIFSLCRARADFFERSGVGILELSCGVAWRLSDERESLGDENSRRCGDGNFSIGRYAFERACTAGVARTPQSSKRIGFSECVRGFDHNWLRPVLLGRRKTASMDELDSSRGRTGFADFVADPHLSGKKDTPTGLILNEIAFRTWRRR